MDGLEGKERGGRSRRGVEKTARVRNKSSVCAILLVWSA